MRIITLGNGQQVTLAQYADAWRACKASSPGTKFRQGLGGFWPQTREEILRDFMRGVHDRITQGIPYSERNVS